MHYISALLKTLAVLREHQPWKLVLIFFISLINGLSAGFSIVLLIPLLQLLNLGNSEHLSGISLYLQQIFFKTGIELSVESVLLIYLVILTIMPLLAYINSLLDARYQQDFIYNMRRRIFRKIILADWMLLNQKSKNNYLQVLTNEVPNVANYYFFYLHLLRSIIMITSYIIWAILISFKITLFIIGTGIVLFFLLRKYLFKAFDLGNDFLNVYTQLLKYIDDFWQTVKIAKVHNSENFYYQKFEHTTNHLMDLEYRMKKNHALPNLLFRVTSIFILVVVIYIGFKLLNTPMTTFFILILLFSRILPQLASLNTDMNQIISSLPSVQMVMRLDDELHDNLFHLSSKSNKLPVVIDIKIAHLTFAYPGGENLFENFTETIPAKKVTGILGESGCGKTTLIDIIAGLQKPHEGNIIVDGIVLNDNLLPAWKNSIGYLPQDSFFIEGTLRENLIWDSEQKVSDQIILEVLEKVNALHLIKRLHKGLDEHIVNYQYHFSGGERQRLAL